MNKPISTALCSFGMSGQVFHGPLLHSSPYFSIDKIWERSKNLSREKYPGAVIVREYEGILDDPAIELVIVNTPDHLHHEQAKKALEAGKHVVVEKPFTQDVQQGEELIQLARKKNKVLSVFQNRRWDGDFLTVQKVVRNQLLGRLVEFESHFDRYRNYTKNDSWKENASFGTGTLYNLGSHMIDQAICLFGNPESVWADSRKQRDNAEVDDYYHLDLEYKDMKVTLKGGYLVREPGPRYTLHGTEGSFLKWGLDPQEEALKNGRLPLEDSWGSEPEEFWGLLNTRLEGLHYRGKIETLAGDYPAYFRNIHDTIKGISELAVKPEESLAGIKIIEAAKESNKEKQRVKLF
jgi:predicted dehydrogenase